MYNDPRKVSLILCPIAAVLCAGLGVWSLFSEPGIVGAAVFFLMAAAMVLPLLAARNRKTILRDEDFAYRTMFGKTYEYRYSDIEWYDDRTHDLILHMRDRKLYLDKDCEEGHPMLEKLRQLDIFDHDPSKPAKKAEVGESGGKVLRHADRKAVGGVMLFLAALTIALTVLIFALPGADEPHKLFWSVLVVLMMGASTAVMIRAALMFLVEKIELTAEDFVHTDSLGRRREYARGDVARVETKLNRFNRPNYYLHMKDGRRIFADRYMMESGLGEAIGFDYRQDRLKKEL